MLASRGLDECVTWSFISEEHAKMFGGGSAALKLDNPITEDLSDMRPSLLPNLLDAGIRNAQRGFSDLGFYEVAKHYYFPGWHQPTTLGELMINLDDWNSIAPTQQAIIESVCKENITRSLAESEAIQFQALEELQSKGVVLHRWSPEILAKFEVAWGEVAIEEAAKDADFARVWESLQKFRKGYKVWGDLGYLN